MDAFLQLRTSLRNLFRQQAWEAAHRLPAALESEDDFTLDHYNGPMLTVLRAPAHRLWTQGMVRGHAALARRRPRPARPRFADHFGPAVTVVRAESRVVRKVNAFALSNPRVLDAVDELVLKFCRETNATATLRLREARAEIRRLLKRNLARGEAAALLARQIYKILADPRRAEVVAVTERSRALNGGEVMAYKDSGVVEKKGWLASADSCPACILLDGKEVGLDEPFHVDPTRGPYALTYHPPLHPNCDCVTEPIL